MTTAKVISLNKSGIATTDEIIAEARAGRMFILVDDENRENEGDLIIPAARVTPESINFMARFGRGLICLAMEGAMIDRLRLPMMTDRNTSTFNTAFTVSIGAKDGITTGISVADRARTVQVAIDPRTGPEDVSVPGHIFPLRARPGGVLERAGHTEAAVEAAKLAGYSGAAVICEVMNDDGTMARLPELLRFSAAHGMKVGTIAGMVDAVRRRP
ncbi:MAG: 3,4-dihydroxy-2-butanone-4-phosphate synthase [Proteobacteria bacterium]|nr:3,4-dihydroxy-2-butanone-4-phosphate synthase [Pseudomonadota bacterium]